MRTAAALPGRARSRRPLRLRRRAQRGLDDDRPRGVRASCPSRARSNRAPDGGQVAHRGWALPNEDAHRGLVTDPVARGNRVGEVLRGAIADTQGRGDAALGPARRPGGQHVLGHEENAQGRLASDLQGGGQPGNARADDHHIRFRVPARRRSPQARGQHQRDHLDVVDEPGTANLHGAQQARRTVVRHGIQVGRAQRQVVDDGRSAEGSPGPPQAPHPEPAGAACCPRSHTTGSPRACCRSAPRDKCSGWRRRGRLHRARSAR